MKKFCLILMLLSTTSPFVLGQSTSNFISAEDAQQQQFNTRREAEAQFYGEMIGKTFWYKPGKFKSSFHDFYLSVIPVLGLVTYKNQFFPQNLMKFEVIDSLQMGTTYTGRREYTYKIRFQDSTEAFMKGTSFGIFTGSAKHSYYSNEASVSTSAMDAKSDRETHIFLEDPAVIIARHDQKEKDVAERMEAEKAKIEKEKVEQVAAEAKADAKRLKAIAMNAKKGGVSLGMSKKQVLASNWGKPNQINRTIWSGGTREQWVYGRASYLYFTNDILATIQN